MLSEHKNTTWWALTCCTWCTPTLLESEHCYTCAWLASLSTLCLPIIIFDSNRQTSFFPTCMLWRTRDNLKFTTSNMIFRSTDLNASEPNLHNNEAMTSVLLWSLLSSVSFVAILIMMSNWLNDAPRWSWDIYSSLSFWVRALTSIGCSSAVFWVGNIQVTSGLECNIIGQARH